MTFLSQRVIVGLLEIQSNFCRKDVLTADRCVALRSGGLEFGACSTADRSGPRGRVVFRFAASALDDRGDYQHVSTGRSRRTAASGRRCSSRCKDEAVDLFRDSMYQDLAHERYQLGKQSRRRSALKGIRTLTIDIARSKKWRSLVSLATQVVWLATSIKGRPLQFLDVSSVGRYSPPLVNLDAHKIKEFIQTTRGARVSEEGTGDSR